MLLVKPESCHLLETPRRQSWGRKWTDGFWRTKIASGQRYKLLQVWQDDSFAKVDPDVGLGRLPFVAPVNTASLNPEMGSAATLSPHGRMQGRAASVVDPDVPPRRGSDHDSKFDGLSTSARASETDAPVLAIIPDQDQVALRKACWERVVLNDRQPSCRTMRVPEPAEPPDDLHLPTPLLLRRAGSPRRGSAAPRPRRPLAFLSKLSSGK